MQRYLKTLLFIPVLTLFFNSAWANCTGHFINPITDICWSCLLPLSVGDLTVASNGLPDTPNPSTPVEVCPMKTGYRIGLNIGYWEPFSIVDVTPTPYCLVNLGGIELTDMGEKFHGGSFESSGQDGAFYQVHWYKYPLIYWLQILQSVACFQMAEFDVAYLSELDPTWNDDELDFVLHPESALVTNPIAQMACAGDSISAMHGLPQDKLFWCAGAQGSMYPVTGTVPYDKSPLETSLLLAERMAFKLHRIGLILESSPEAGNGIDGPICHQYYSAILPKSRYRYQLINPSAAADQCAPFGRATFAIEPGHLAPNDTGDRGYLIWRKRNCSFI